MSIKDWYISNIWNNKGSDVNVIFLIFQMLQYFSFHLFLFFYMKCVYDGNFTHRLLKNTPYPLKMLNPYVLILFIYSLKCSENLGTHSCWHDTKICAIFIESNLPHCLKTSISVRFFHTTTIKRYNVIFKIYSTNLLVGLFKSHNP